MEERLEQRLYRLVLVRILAVVSAGALTAATAAAQVTPAAGYTPPDDTPSIKIGATLFADYTYTLKPASTDADGNAINPSAFNVTRSYINVTGNVSHVIAFRFTPDITRESSLVTVAPGGSVANDSLVFRVKYAFLQANLDDWMTKGSWARFGIQQTPIVDYEEGIYRYRFQGTTFTEREGYLTSSDAGASFHWNIPSNYGELHVGFYNGDGYARPEQNNQQAIQVRATVRPFASSGTIALRGLRVTGFYDGDHYISNAERTRAVAQVTFEHAYVNAGFDFIDAKDQPSITKAEIEGRGWSFWLTPRSRIGWEALIRYDHMQPDVARDSQVRERTILGVAYWFPHTGGPTAAILLDYDGQTFSNFAPSLPKQSKFGIHGLINF